MKFTPPGGYISVTGLESKGFYWIEVRDSGRGIDEELVQHLFKPFFQIQADGANNGLGLGLSVVKAIIELHGGQIEVSSDGLGRGTSFRVGIPATSAFGGSAHH